MVEIIGTDEKFLINPRHVVIVLLGEGRVVKDRYWKKLTVIMTHGDISVDFYNEDTPRAEDYYRVLQYWGDKYDKSSS